MAISINPIFQKKVDITKYLDLPYKQNGYNFDGVDCYGLFHLFNKEEFRLDLPQYQTKEKWVENNEKLKNFKYIQEHCMDSTIPIETPHRYCAVVFTKLGTEIEAHIGIMVDDVNFLNIRQNTCSRIDKITHRYWKKVFSEFRTINKIEQWKIN